MALQTPTVSVTGVTEPQEKLYKIAFRMVATDDTAGLTGLDEMYVTNYKKDNNIADKVAEVTKHFQEKIDRYQNAIGIYETPALATAVISIQTGLVV